MYLSGCERVPCASCGLAQARLLTQRVQWTAGVVVERALACMKVFILCYSGKTGYTLCHLAGLQTTH